MNWEALDRTSLVLIAVAVCLGFGALVAPAGAQPPRVAAAQNDGHAGHEHEHDDGQESVSDSTDGHTGHDHGEAEASGDGHDHSAHEHGAGQTGFLRFVSWLGNFHPPMINFPIGLLIAAAFAEVLFMSTGRASFDHAGWYCTWIGVVGAVVAAILGWFFGGFRLVDEDWIMTTHRWLGTVAGLWALVLGWLTTRAYAADVERAARWRPRYRVALFLAAGLVAANGFFGGAMLYGLDHYV